MSGCFTENNVELQIHTTGYELTGNSYHYQNINYYVKKNIRGKFDPKAKKVFIREGDVTTFHIPQGCKICVKNFDLTYTTDGKIETLVGTWDGKILGTNQDCSTGPITLSRIKESAFKEIPEILVDTGTIRLDFYDNAIVDGDSITVLIDKNVVLSHQMLTTKPITAYIKIDLQNPFHEVEMVAENLGSIPPNTALLIITAGDKKYRLQLSSTLQKSAMVRFVYNKKE